MIMSHFVIITKCVWILYSEHACMYSKPLIIRIALLFFLFQICENFKLMKYTKCRLFFSLKVMFGFMGVLIREIQTS